ncbi:hypothetical protein NUW58_g65 [Xylaria curta]|uniref:Uncharacterized protein n=1 Tax=Xylaria curta TaxID=42375 RepID=A0ACC1PSE6_9PEZI|nr:hypothetical protein NUW58_g65 [Xylaria curta]
MGLFKHAFQELLTRHLMGNETYEAEDVNVFEISGPPEQLSTFQSFVVKVDDVKGWLSSIHQGENQQRVDNPSLRVMLGSGLTREKGEYTGRGVGMGDAKPKPTKPFLRDDYDLLEQAFLLPKTTMIPLTGEPGPLRGHFDVYQGLREDGKPIFDRKFDELHDLEISSGQTGIGMTGAKQLGRCDDPQLPLAILGVTQVAMAIESYIKGHLLTVESMCKELEAFPHLLPEPERARAREHNDLIAQHLD